MVYPRTFYTDLNSLFCKPPKVATLTRPFPEKVNVEKVFGLRGSGARRLAVVDRSAVLAYTRPHYAFGLSRNCRDGPQV